MQHTYHASHPQSPKSIELALLVSRLFSVNRLKRLNQITAESTHRAINVDKIVIKNILSILSLLE